MTDWSSLKVVDLKAELLKKDLSTKGLKADLVQRLDEYDAAAASPVDELVVEDDSAIETVPPSGDDNPSNESPELQSPKLPIGEAISTHAIAIEETASRPEAAIDAQTQLEPPTSQDPVTSANIAAGIEHNEQSASVTPLPSTETVADLQKRKRRSSTPQPSTKRARQENERLADSREDIVDSEYTNKTSEETIPAVISNKSQNGVDTVDASQEDVNMMKEEQYTEVPAVDKATVADWEPLEVSGEDAYAKRVAIAESFKLRSPSMPQTQGLSLDGSGENGYVKPKSSAQYPNSSMDTSGEDAYAKRVAIAELQRSSSLPRHAPEGRRSQAASRSPRPEQRPYKDSQNDGLQQSHGAVKYEVNDASLPSTHSPTSALYIRELMRPLKSEVMEQHIVDMISSSDDNPDADPIHDFYLDQIRTHAFVRLPSISAAQLVRAALHNQVWPNERNRKALWVDFIPAESVKDWIELEESAPRGARWEVVYEQSGANIVAVHREVGLDNKSFSRPPPTGPAATGPVYPGIESAPRGPRGGGGRATFQNPNTRQTATVPQLLYSPKDKDVARRRIDNMRSFYARDPPPDLGKDYHRFTFETADAFVDRGREVFIGIRPPHRQREHEERLRREGPTTAGARSVAGSRRDDYRPAPRPSVTDEDRLSRHGDGRRFDRSDRLPRNRGFRSDRGPGRYRGEDPYRYRPGY